MIYFGLKKFHWRISQFHFTSLILLTKFPSCIIDFEAYKRVEFILHENLRVVNYKKSTKVDHWSPQTAAKCELRYLQLLLER